MIIHVVDKTGRELSPDELRTTDFVTPEIRNIYAEVFERLRAAKETSGEPERA